MLAIAGGFDISRASLFRRAGEGVRYLPKRLEMRDSGLPASCDEAAWSIAAHA